MIKVPVSLQDLRRRIYLKAKSDKTHRFWGIFVHITKMETLREAYNQAKKNGGAPGTDGQTFTTIEEMGVDQFLFEIRNNLIRGSSSNGTESVDKEIMKSVFAALSFPLITASGTENEYCPSILI